MVAVDSTDDIFADPDEVEWLIDDLLSPSDPDKTSSFR